MTETLPHLFLVERRAERVVVWSPPRVMIRGTVDRSEFAGRPAETSLWTRSSIFKAARLSSQGKGASPQSTTLAQSCNESRVCLSRMLYPKIFCWLALRIPEGPYRAPGRSVTVCRMGGRFDF